MKDSDFTFSDGTPGLFKIKDLENINSQIREGITHIRSAKNARIVVLETWLIVDWFVSHLILSGIGAIDHDVKKLNIFSSLLPRRFETRLDFLKEFIEVQRNLEVKPVDESHKLSISLKFFSYMKSKYKDVLDQLIEIENEFNIEELGLSENTLQVSRPVLLDGKQFRTVSESWLDSVESLGKLWFQKASNLNKARNQAAHSYAQNEVYQAFGINGTKKFQLLKSYCLELLEELIGIEKKSV